MPSFRAYLQTKVARRVFGLFLVCAVVPTATLAGSGYWLIAREYQVQASLQLAQASKVSGALILARLQAADAELAHVARSMRSTNYEFSAARLRGATLVRSGRGALTVLGDPPGPLPAIPIQSSSHLESGRAALISQVGGDSPIFLLRRVGGEGSHLWGELSSAALWGLTDSEPLSPPGIGLCVFVATAVAPLYCSSGVAAISTSRDRWVQGERSAVLESSGQRFIAEASSIFLGFEYAAEPWIIVLEQPLLSVAGKQTFQRTMLLTCVLGISLVVLASNVLLRQRLDPVARLQEGTRRLAAGDFGTMVQVSTGDEFQDLAASFNGMAAGLRRQFELLDALQQVDREALDGRSAGAVAEVAAARIRGLIAAEVEVSLIVARRDGESASLIRWRCPDRGSPERSEARAPVAQLDEWLSCPPAFFLPENHETGPLRAFGGVRSGCLVLPFLEQGACVGGIILHASDGGSSFPSGDVGRMRQLADQTGLALSHQLSIERLKEMMWGTLEALARTIDANSPWTAGHSERVTRLAIAIGRHMDLCEADLERLHRGGLLHDVGKIGIPRSILDKPGPLTAAEMALVREHPVVGARILEPIQAFADAIDIVRHHHEWFNGRGYPDRLVGDRIPPLARVLTVADVYDALVSSRPYRAGWSATRAKTHITRGAGAQFDPVVVQAFLELAESEDWSIATSVTATPIRRRSAEPGPPDLLETIR